MAPGEQRAIGLTDLERAARAVAHELDVDEVVVIGSQALLVHHGDILTALRFSREIDAYPSHALDPDRFDFTERASHTINALFGEGSIFHRTHQFFIDGVSSRTASLPPDWRKRAASRRVEVGPGRTVTIIAPAVADIATSKLARGEEKDVVFVSLCMATGLVRNAQIAASIRAALTDDAQARALTLLERATKSQRREMEKARRDESVLADGIKGNPLDDLSAIEALRRAIDQGDGT